MNDMSKRALVTGACGQDARHLIPYLLDLGYDVYGLVRRTGNTIKLDDISNFVDHRRFHLVEGDITDFGKMSTLISELQVDEFYSLAALSHVGHSFECPAVTMNANATAVINILDAIRSRSPKTRIHQSSTSEMYGGFNCPEQGFNEESPMNPRSPYAVAKLAAHKSIKLYRDMKNGIFASAGILFNHCGIYRPPDFVTRKITQGVARIVTGKQKTIKLGNLDAYRDEGSAEEYVKAMHLILQQDSPGDFVIATGRSLSIKQMLQFVCEEAGISFDDAYEVDQRFMRPSEVPYLKGDITKAREVLGWSPEKTCEDVLFKMLLHDMKIEKSKES
jgi:GDPmannose 4,6-dehydratase